LKNTLAQEIFDELGAGDDLNQGVFNFVAVFILCFEVLFGVWNVFWGFVYSLEKEHKSFHLHIFVMFKLDFDYEEALANMQAKRIEEKKGPI
jgi:hypothetical protein